MEQGSELDIHNLPTQTHQASPELTDESANLQMPPVGQRPLMSDQDAQRDNLLNTLLQVGNLTEAGRVLQLDRRTMYRRVRLYGLEDWREQRLTMLEREAKEREDDLSPTS